MDIEIHFSNTKSNLLKKYYFYSNTYDKSTTPKYRKSHFYDIPTLNLSYIVQ